MARKEVFSEITETPEIDNDVRTTYMVIEPFTAHINNRNIIGTFNTPVDLTPTEYGFLKNRVV